MRIHIHHFKVVEDADTFWVLECECGRLAVYERWRWTAKMKNLLPTVYA